MRPSVSGPGIPRRLRGRVFRFRPIVWGSPLLAVLACTALSCAGEETEELPALDAGPSNSTDVGDVPVADAGSRADLVERMVSMIRTDVEPDFVYEYEGAKFVPPAGKTLLIVGQTLRGIDEHVESFPNEPLPGGWAAYWGIPSMDGVDTTFLNDTGGRQNHQQLVDRFPNTVLQSGLWMVGRWNVARNTADGVYDDVVRAFSAWAKQTNRPIYLRIGYEFDGPHNELEPVEYIRAYRRVVDIMREEAVENVAFVWHSYASPTYMSYPLADWYPGDDYVDWVAVSLFGHMYSAAPTAELDAVFEFAKVQKKPVMIAESSPTNGIRGNTAWNGWFVNFFSLAYQKNIKAISFINENWERFDFPGTSWADARLQNDQLVSEAWFTETGKDRYLKQSPTLFDELGFIP